MLRVLASFFVFIQLYQSVFGINCQKYHTVQSGEYCYLIAVGAGLDLNRLQQLNPGLNCFALQPGQKVCIAEGSDSSSNNPRQGTNCAKRHTVQAGEYCYLIAERNRLTIDALRALNPGLQCENLKIGLELCVAAGSSDSGSTNDGSKNDQNSKDDSGSSSKDDSKSDLLTFKEFVSAVKAAGYPEPTEKQYKAVVNQCVKAGGITTKRELAMFLSQILWESGGLKYKSEIKCEKDGCPGEYVGAEDRPGKRYFGRGYIQLTWSSNYRAASFDLYGDDRLLSNPESVAEDESIAWATAFWYWKTRVRNSGGVQQGQFGAATNAINGALECRGANRDKAEKRFEIYKKVLKEFSIDEKPDERGCYS